MDSAWKVCILVVALGIFRALFPVSLPEQNNAEVEHKSADVLIPVVPPSNPIDEELLYSPKKYPPSPASRALRNQVGRVLKNSNSDLTMMQIADHVVRATNYLLNETLPADYEMPTLVTGAWSIGEERDSEHASQVPWILRFLKHKLPKIVFTDLDTYTRLRHIAVDIADTSITTFVIMSASQIEQGLGSSATQQIFNIRTNPAFLNLASWIPKSILGTSQTHTVLALSKPFILREASRLNPFRTSSFLWLDQFDECMSESLVLTPQHVPQLNRLLDRVVAPFITRELNPAASEVLGFRQPSFSFYKKSVQNDLPKSEQDDSQVLQIVRSSSFGGKVGHIEILAAVHELILRSSIWEGLLGNLEAYLTIIAHRHADLFHLINDESTCKDSKMADLTCEDDNSNRNKAANGKCGLIGLISSD